MLRTGAILRAPAIHAATPGHPLRDRLHRHLRRPRRAGPVRRERCLGAPRGGAHDRLPQRQVPPSARPLLPLGQLRLLPGARGRRSQPARLPDLVPGRHARREPERLAGRRPRPARGHRPAHPRRARRAPHAHPSTAGEPGADRLHPQAGRVRTDARPSRPARAAGLGRGLRRPGPGRRPGRPRRRRGPRRVPAAASSSPSATSSPEGASAPASSPAPPPPPGPPTSSGP